MDDETAIEAGKAICKFSDIGGKHPLIPDPIPSVVARLTVLAEAGLAASKAGASTFAGKPDSKLEAALENERGSHAVTREALKERAAEADALAAENKKLTAEVARLKAAASGEAVEAGARKGGRA